MLIRTTILALAFGAFIQSCGDVKTTCDPIATTGANVTKASLSSIQTTVFDKQCATSGCHVEGGDDPLLTADKSYAALVNADALGSPLKYVTPGDPTNSFLMQKIYGANANMPKNASPLPKNVIDSISAWIAKGAPND